MGAERLGPAESTLNSSGQKKKKEVCQKKKEEKYVKEKGVLTGIGRGEFSLYLRFSHACR